MGLIGVVFEEGEYDLSLGGETGFVDCIKDAEHHSSVVGV